MLSAAALSVYRQGVPVLVDIHLQLPAGTICGVIGPNGAGKTTLLKRLAAQLQGPGTVYLQQHNIDHLSLRTRAQRIAVLNQTQDTALWALTVRQVTALGLLPHATWLHSRTQDQQAVLTALAQVGLATQAELPFNQLSGGEQQRCLIAQTLVQRALLMVLDEPVNHLDIYYQHHILQHLRTGCKEQQRLLVISLHDLNLAARYCDQLLLLAQGRLVATGTPQSVLQAQTLQTTFGLSCVVTATEDGYPSVAFRAQP